MRPLSHHAAFPRSKDRGLIEALLMGLEDYETIAFPRSKDRGLIEADLCRRAIGVERNHFRGRKIAASLKHSYYPHRDSGSVISAVERSRPH